MPATKSRITAPHELIAIVSETDRVYLNTKHAIELEDQALPRRIGICQAELVEYSAHKLFSRIAQSRPWNFDFRLPEFLQ